MLTQDGHLVEAMSNANPAAFPTYCGNTYKQTLRTQVREEPAPAMPKGCAPVRYNDIHPEARGRRLWATFPNCMGANCWVLA